MILRNFTIVFSVLLVLASCSGDKPIENKELKEYFSAYLNDNDKVVAFGNAKIKDILNKAQYEKVSMLNAIVGGQLKTFEGVIDLDGPVYYTANAPMNKDGAPEEIILFIEVVDDAKLKNHLVSEMGYDINEGDGFSYTSDGDMALGIRNNLLIVLVKPGDYNEKMELAAAFKKVDGKVNTGAIQKLLDNSEGDIVLSANLENALLNSGNGMDGIPKSNFDELKKLFSGAIVNTTVKFENGQAIVETKNHFGKELMDRMFFSKDPNAKVIDHLGGGEPVAGFSMNIDLKKMEAFVDGVHPQGMNKLGGMKYVGMKFIAGVEGLSEIIDGNIGIVFFAPTKGELNKSDWMNIYLGLKPKGEQLLQEAKPTISSMLPSDLPAYKIQKDGLSVEGNTAQTGTKLSLPAVANDFGKSGINFFINLEELDVSDLEILFNNSDYGPILKVAKSISFSYNNEGGKLIITAKNGKENILKQALEVAVSDVSDLMGGVSF